MKPGDLLISDFPDVHTPQPIMVVEILKDIGNHEYFSGINPKGKMVLFAQWGWKVISDEER